MTHCTPPVWPCCPSSSRRPTRFVEQLAAAGAELQTDMALDLVIAHRTDAERALLRRLSAYRTPVPIEGIVKLGLDLPEPRRLLDGLLAVSLIEQREAPDLLAREYQCPATVADWLARQPGGGLEANWLGVAADFQLYLFRTARQTFDQAVAVHEALRAAGRRDEADRWVLDRVVGPMNRAGLYAACSRIGCRRSASRSSPRPGPRRWVRLAINISISATTRSRSAICKTRSPSGRRSVIARARA
ncbi:hypothetical protein [uncultured Thiodictyon sp.]|uniref:hypothetical protein n=1 Tax=uncultured Thiodictyon sp. TaxID=1846217 RepID=UPI0025D34571|nr:hypothetical protein [uncultured Thiodictyon sp.]